MRKQQKRFLHRQTNPSFIIFPGKALDMNLNQLLKFTQPR